MLNETRERFLKSILGQIAPERIVEIHFFPPIRQGQVETGVAVVAIESPRVVFATVAAEARVLDADPTADGVDPAADAADAAAAADADAEPGAAPDTDAPFAVSTRLEVHTASYRWTRKGPERGKWEVEVKAQADAPLPTVGTVVRGVQERSGDGDDALRLGADDLRALMDEPSWQRTTP